MSFTPENPDPDLPSDVKEDLELQAQILTQEMGGKLKRWRKLGNDGGGPVVMIIKVEPGKAVFFRNGRFPDPYPALKVVFLNNDKIDNCTFSASTPGDSLLSKVQQNFIDPDETDNHRE